MSVCAHKFRFVVLFVGFACLFAVSANYMIINFTFICMTDDAGDVIDVGNGTMRQRYDYTPAERTYIHWGVAIGTIVGTFPINWAYTKFGAKYPFLLSGLLSAAATALTPAAAHLGIVPFVAVRFLQGLAFAADFAALGMLTTRWAPLAETGIFLGFLTSFTPLSNTVSNGLGGLLCTTLGWRAAFYIFAAFTLLFFAIWFFVYTDDPQTHWGVSAVELKKIEQDKTKEHCERQTFVPYKDVCTSVIILVVWFNAFTELVGLVSLLTYAPIYLKKVVGLSVHQTAFFTSIGSALHLPVKLVAAFLSDYVTYFSEYQKMIFFNTIAVGLVGLSITLIPFSPWQPLTVFFVSIIQVFAGANSSGFYKCGTLHSRQYAHFVLATIQFMKCCALIVGPALYAIFMDSDTDIAGWKIIFLINGIGTLIANFLFYPVATDKPAAWTMARKKEDEELRG